MPTHNSTQWGCSGGLARQSRILVHSGIHRFHGHSLRHTCIAGLDGSLGKMAREHFEG